MQIPTIGSIREYRWAAALAIASVLALAWLASGSASAAERIIKTCAGEEGDRATCYEREVPALYPKRSLAELFDIIRDIRHADPSYQFCHVLAHKLGEMTVAEDPEAWVDAIPLNPSDGLCSNGFIHGVVGGRFRAEVLHADTIAAHMPDFRRACEPRLDWHPSDLDRAICYHGMGHLFLFITDGDIDAALGICERAADTHYRRVCVQGVFMQIYQPLEPDDYALIERLKVKPTKENVRPLCAAYRHDPLYEGSCLQESWPFFREDILSGHGVVSFCTGYPSFEEEEQCYTTASALIGRTSLSDPQKAAGACSSLTEQRQLACFANAAQAFLEENRTEANRALQLCEMSGALSDSCMMILIEREQFIFGSDTSLRTAFCAALPRHLQHACRF
jgi:hypothetical protein